MSYEGYEVWLCANGHRHDYDCYCTPDHRVWACPDCGSSRVWWCPVDQTNDSGKPPRLKIATPTKSETCSHCGVTRVTAPQTFVIPGKRKP